jgi:hypothetical protein
MKWIAILALSLSASAHAQFGDGLMRIPYSFVATNQESAAAGVLNYCLSTPVMKTGIAVFSGIDDLDVKAMEDGSGEFMAYGECIYKSSFN